MSSMSFTLTTTDHRGCLKHVVEGSLENIYCSTAFASFAYAALLLTLAAVVNCDTESELSQNKNQILWDVVAQGALKSRRTKSLTAFFSHSKARAQGDGLQNTGIL